MNDKDVFSRYEVFFRNRRDQLLPIILNMRDELDYVIYGQPGIFRSIISAVKMAVWVIRIRNICCKKKNQTDEDV